MGIFKKKSKKGDIMVIAKRKGYEIIIKKPELAQLERKIVKEIHEEERKKGFLPAVFRLAEKAYKKEEEIEKHFEEASRQQRFRELEKNLKLLEGNVGKMSYKELQKELDEINYEHETIEKTQKQIEMEKGEKDKPIEEKLLEALQGRKAYSREEMKKFRETYLKMKELLLKQIVKKELSMKKLGKII
jgi:TolA-binding protein